MAPFQKNIPLSHLALLGYVAALLMLVSTCVRENAEVKLTGVRHFSGTEFAGSSSCANCHQDITEAHAQTAHARTSAIADNTTVMGSLDSGENVLILNDRLKIIIDSTSSRLIQRGIVGGTEVVRKPMDLIIGSGRKGQSYLYWEDSSLFQLPASYYTAGDTWSNSPGYPADQLIFNRSIPARCLECHSTFFKTEKMVAGRERFNPHQVMLGVDCERCHGPAGDHVRFHLEHPEESQPRHVINPASLSRQRRLDNCALCHSGVRENLMPSFSYTVGENLDDYSFPTYAADSAATLDVHGNQYGLLLQSECFKGSEMDCSSCHDVHKKESKQMGVFSSRCMNCHARGTDRFCKQEEVPGLVLTENCIDCHMPELPSRQVFLAASEKGSTSRFFVRTHLIDTYDAKVKEFIARLRAK